MFGHEITGEVVSKGSDVEFVRVGDLVSVPFNIACGRCQVSVPSRERVQPEQLYGLVPT